MTEYVLKKMGKDWGQTLGNIILNGSLLTVFVICVHIAYKIKELLKNKWYKRSIKIASIWDGYIREKMGVILWGILVLALVIIVFCLLACAVKIWIDFARESSRICMFEIIGYSHRQRIHSLYIGKLAELIFAGVLGCILGNMLWDVLCGQKKFYFLLTLADMDVEFKTGYLLMGVLLMGIWEYIVYFFLVMKKQKLSLISRLKNNEN